MNSREWINLFFTLHVNSEELLHRSLGWTGTGQSEMVGLGPAQFKKEKIYL
jgi:hypothetical protein